MKLKKALILSSLLLAGPVLAAKGVTVETVANKVLDNITNIPTLLSGFSYVAAIALSFKGAMKLKEMNDSRGQIKLSSPLMLLAAGAMLFALPSLLGAGISTIGYDKTGKSVKRIADRPTEY